MQATNKSEKEVKRLNEDLEQRHYEFVSNCDDGKGDPAACHSYGEWLSVVERDYEKAALFYRRNCEEKKYAGSCFNLGRLYLAGKGVPQDDKQASKYLKTACDEGHMFACHNLGVMYMNGIGVEKDATTGLGYLRAACEKGDPSSCYRLASLHLQQRNGPVSRDPVMAEKYLIPACEQNHAPSCHNLAVMYKQGDGKVAKNQELYEKYKNQTNDLIEQAGKMSGFKIA